MREFSGLADKLCEGGMPIAEAVSTVQTVWSRRVWKCMSAAYTIGQEQGIGAFAEDQAKATLFDIWQMGELGEGGRRLMLYKNAISCGAQPKTQTSSAL